MSDPRPDPGRGTTHPRTRRWPLGQSEGSGGWSPLASASSYEPEENRYWLEREMTLLERALEDKGEMRRRELGDLVGCKYWGPSRFARALREAVAQRRIEHTGLGRYGPARQ
jgi:hypothetical protein